MKVILSRKGFDSQSGGMPNIILPDGTLLSLPIPSAYGETTYHDISYNGKTYFDIIKELRPKVAENLEIHYECRCHVDPDLTNKYIDSPHNWSPAFGQQGISQLHLENHEVSVGDIFLFYGWFRQTEYDKNGKLRFIDKRKDDTVDKHVIYGYMEIGEIITNQDEIKERFPYHPHALENYSQNNALYLPSKTLSFDSSRNGCGVLNNAPIRQLTKVRHKRSEWDLPDCFKGIEISYHEKDSYGWVCDNDYFKAAYRGQEFVVKKDMTDDMKEWVKKVILSE